MSEWQECLGSDENLRAEIIKRIEEKRAFWVLPEAEEILYLYGEVDPIIIRDLGGGILEWMLSEDEAQNEDGLKAWKEVDVEGDANEFFSVTENENWEEFEAAKESIGMAEAEPDEVNTAVELDGEVMAVLLLVKRGLWPKRKAHPGYPAPMKVWTYVI